MMNRALVVVCYASVAAALASAQPIAPSLEQIERLRALSEIDPHMAAAGEPWVVDTASREETRQFYRSIYFASEGVPMDWTGDVATGNPGTTSAAFKEAVRVRINFFRALAGVPAAVTLNSTFSGKAQQAALMMSANSQLSHFPPNTWTHYTADGAEAAAASNIALGVAGPDAVTGYMADAGTNNGVVGHRRWIVHPQTQEMGTGDVAGGGGFSPANAIWVQDANVFATRPATRDTFVSFPSPGHVPYQLVFPRWSFSYPGANFGSATVTMTSGGNPVPVTIETRGSGSGAPENTIVWIYNNLNIANATPHPKPVADTTYTVQVNGVLIGGSPQNFQYDVIVFDPDVAGVDFVDTVVAGPANPGVGVGNSYTATIPAFADQFQWRSLQVATFNTTYGAEGDLQGVVADISAGYDARVTSSTDSGNGAYHLAHPSPPTGQYLTLPGTFFLPTGGSGAVSFRSRLGFATAGQIAHVQISSDDGNSWSDVYTQAGTDGSGEGSYNSRNVDLAPYAGQTFQVRFAYTLTTLSFFSQTAPNAGWLIDNITLTGVQAVTASAPVDVTSGTTFAFTPAVEGSYGLQARGVLFTAYPIDWGTVTIVNATDNDIAPAITTQPTDANVTAGASAMFTAAASGSPTPTLQWQISTNGGAAWSNVTNDATYAGATTGTLTVNSTTVAMTGHQFRMVASNGVGTPANSNAAVLTVDKATATIALSNLSRAYTGAALSPTAVTTPAGLTVEFTFAGSAVAPSAVGSYALVATINDANYQGTATNTFAIVPALVLGEAGPIATSAGGATTLSVAATAGTTATYQWQMQPVGGGAFVDLPGATAASYVLPSSQRFHAGNYRVVVNANGVSATSGTIVVSVNAPAANNARLLNLSTRGLAQSGDNILIPGFVVQGTTDKRLLIRAVGPTLDLPPINGVGDVVVPDPVMTLKRFNFTTMAYEDVEANDDWGTNTNAAEITTTSVTLGAFALLDSKEAALLIDLPAGQYSVFASDKNEASGIAIVELYDADASGTTARLINISNRGFVGTGARVMIPGFVVSPEGPKTLLIRVVGPTLAGAPYNVPGTMADPKLDLFKHNFVTNADDLLLSQDNWSDNPDSAFTVSTAAQVSAFALDDGSADAAFVVTLEPGVYTVIGSSADAGGSGVVLVEVYIVP